MKFIVDPLTHPGFLLFLELPQAGDTLAHPSAIQVRGGELLLQRLAKLLAQASDRLAWVDEAFHESEEARRAFEEGEVLASPGEPLLVVTMQQRKCTLLSGCTVLTKSTADLNALRSALTAAQKALAAPVRQSRSNLG